MKNDALKVIKNKLQHDVQQKREIGKISYEVCRVTLKVQQRRFFKSSKFYPHLKKLLFFFTCSYSEGGI